LSKIDFDAEPALINPVAAGEEASALVPVCGSTGFSQDFCSRLEYFYYLA
jgi:hypothetical protein